jgi:murein DD-endopeptidase MepM/ murein hydrolase activator NlpD
LKQALFIFLFLILTATGAVFYFGYGELALNLFEKTPPDIHLTEIPEGIGLAPTSFTVSFADLGSGLSKVKIEAIHNNTTTEVFKRSYQLTRTTSDSVVQEIQGKNSPYKSGEVTFRITAQDNSFISNRSSKEFTLVIDYQRPRLEVLTAQHNVTQGNPSLVFYRITEQNPKLVGVKVGDLFFNGYQAAKLDPVFNNNPDVYFSYFAIPFEFDIAKDKIAIFAEDAVGNNSALSFYYRIARKNRPISKLTLSREFLDRKLPELLPEYYELQSALLGSKIEEIEPSTDEEFAVNFRRINEEFRSLLQKKLQPIWGNSIEEQLWGGLFIRPIAAARTAAYGEQRFYSFNGIDAGTSYHDGLDLASTSHDEVKSTNRGKVVYADNLGIYGTTVILDHGFGLFSLYGHLSSITCSVGQLLDQGTTIGRTGNTGLAGGDHLHYELRLEGYPIFPITFWDKFWIRDHIEKKIAFVKNSLGLTDN